MYTWEDEITTALRKNGEYWEDIEYTPFSEEQLGMSPDDSDGDLHFSGHEVAAYTEEWVYYVDFDLDWGYATVRSLPRHPRVFIEQEEVRHNIISNDVGVHKKLVRAELKAKIIKLQEELAKL